jgi:hypothetical protein
MLISLPTVEFKADSAGTQPIVTEQGVLPDGCDHAGPRERGARAARSAECSAVT